MKEAEEANSTDLSLLGLDPGKLVWGQLGKIWYPARVAWKKKAPQAVLKLEKSDMVLVHWFDRWSEAQNKPSMWAYAWLPVSKIKDFEGSFDSLSKSKKTKQFVEMVTAAINLCKNFNPPGWDSEILEASKQEEKPKKEEKPKAANKTAKPKEKAQDMALGKMLTERQQLKLLGVKMDDDSSEEEEEEEEEEEGGGERVKEDKMEERTEEKTEMKSSSEQSKKSKKKSASIEESKPKNEDSDEGESKPSKKVSSKSKTKANVSPKKAKQNSDKKSKDSKSKGKSATPKNTEKAKKDKDDGKKKSQGASAENSEKSLVIPEADLVGLSSDDDGDEEAEEVDTRKEVDQPTEKGSSSTTKDTSNSKAKSDAAGGVPEGQVRKEEVGDTESKGDIDVGAKRNRDDALDSANEVNSKSDIQAMDLKKRRLAQWSATATEEPKVEPPAPKGVDVERCRLFLGNLPHGTTQERIMQHIKALGLLDCLDKIFHTPGKRFGFIALKNFESTVRAKKTLEDSRFDGAKIKVEYPKDSFIHTHASQAPTSAERRSSQPPTPSRNGATRDPEPPMGNFESIRNTLAQQVEQQRQQLLAKQRENIKNEVSMMNPPPYAHEPPQGPIHAAIDPRANLMDPRLKPAGSQVQDPRMSSGAVDPRKNPSYEPPASSAMNRQPFPMPERKPEPPSQYQMPNQQGNAPNKLDFSNDQDSAAAVLQMLQDIAASMPQAQHQDFSGGMQQHSHQPEYPNQSRQQLPPYGHPSQGTMNMSPGQRGHMGPLSHMPPPPNEASGPLPGGWDDRGREAYYQPNSYYSHGADAWRDRRQPFPPHDSMEAYPPESDGGRGQVHHREHPREVVMHVPAQLTGMLIGKAGSTIRTLMQEASEIGCHLELKQNKPPPEGNGAGNLVIHGSHGDDVKRVRLRISALLSEAERTGTINLR